MDISQGVIIEFDFSDKGFILRYDLDKDYWYAEHFDEDVYPDPIIIEDQFFKNGVFVVYGFSLNKELFEKFKKIVEREKKNAIR